MTDNNTNPVTGTVITDHFVTKFVVEIRTMSVLSADTVKNHLQKKWEVVDIQEVDRANHERART